MNFLCVIVKSAKAETCDLPISRELLVDSRGNSDGPGTQVSFTADPKEEHGL